MGVTSRYTKHIIIENNRNRRWHWDAPPPCQKSVRTKASVRWRHNQIFSVWCVTNFPYQWRFASTLSVLKLRYQEKNESAAALVGKCNTSNSHIIVVKLPPYGIRSSYNLGQKGLRIFKNRGYFTHYALNIALKQPPPPPLLLMLIKTRFRKLCFF